MFKLDDVILNDIDNDFYLDDNELSKFDIIISIEDGYTLSIEEQYMSKEYTKKLEELLVTATKLLTAPDINCEFKTAIWCINISNFIIEVNKILKKQEYI